MSERTERHDEDERTSHHAQKGRKGAIQSPSEEKTPSKGVIRILHRDVVQFEKMLEGRKEPGDIEMNDNALCLSKSKKAGRWSLEFSDGHSVEIKAILGDAGDLGSGMVEATLEDAEGNVVDQKLRDGEAPRITGVYSFDNDPERSGLPDTDKIEVDVSSR